MRLLALAALMILFGSAPSRAAHPSEEHRPWREVGQVKLELFERNLGGIPFNPALSIEENNRLLDEYRKSATSVALHLPLDCLRKLGQPYDAWIDRSIRLRIGGEYFAGRIHAVTISPSSPSRLATLFAELDLGQKEFDERPQRAKRFLDETGVLSVGE